MADFRGYKRKWSLPTSKLHWITFQPGPAPFQHVRPPVGHMLLFAAGSLFPLPVHYFSEHRRHMFSNSCPTCCCCLVTKSCPALCDPIDCSPPSPSVHGISWIRILEWIALPFSRGSYWPRDWACISCIGRRILFCWGTGRAPRAVLK